VPLLGYGSWTGNPSDPTPLNGIPLNIVCLALFPSIGQASPLRYRQRTVRLGGEASDVYYWSESISIGSNMFGKINPNINFYLVNELQSDGRRQ
jgi:hypothetical protein